MSFRVKISVQVPDAGLKVIGLVEINRESFSRIQLPGFDNLILKVVEGVQDFAKDPTELRMIQTLPSLSAQIIDEKKKVFDFIDHLNRRSKAARLTAKELPLDVVFFLAPQPIDLKDDIIVFKIRIPVSSSIDISDGSVNAKRSRCSEQLDEPSKRQRAITIVPVADAEIPFISPTEIPVFSPTFPNLIAVTNTTNSASDRTSTSLSYASASPSRFSADGSNHPKADFFFAQFPHAVRRKMRFDAEALYSVTDSVSACRISEKLFGLAGICQTSVISDITSCVGGNVISFSTFFSRVNAVEIDPIRFDMLRHNVSLVAERSNVMFFQGNGVQLALDAEISQDIIFADPPWLYTSCFTLSKLKITFYSSGVAPIIGRQPIFICSCLMVTQKSIWRNSLVNCWRAPDMLH